MAKQVPLSGGFKMEDLMALLQGTQERVNVDVEGLKDDEYVRAYRSDLGACLTIVSGLVNGVTFSLEVPKQVDNDAVATVALSTIKAIRENVYLGPGGGPGRDSVQGGGRLSRG
jgi:hypothetical protein